MTFYLKPPRGHIELDKLIECVQLRLEFISSIVSNSQDDSDVLPKNLTYFVEGTAIDRASHYLLRLVSAETGHFQEHVIKAETALFIRRLTLLSEQERVQAIRICRRHCTELLQERKGINRGYYTFLTTLQHLCCDMLRKPGGLAHAFASEHEESCSVMFVKVPYRACMRLIANRLVTLRRGEAIVPCGAWKTLLSEVFRHSLELGIKDMLLSGCHADALKDPRVCSLSRLLKSTSFENLGAFHSGVLHNNENPLTKNQVWEQLPLFPPCLAAMLQSLREHHRIGHHARVALTLSLKECGLPVKEAIDFWRTELSQRPGCSKNGCSHSWQTDERRFTYSVRHMYGLEGGRKNYAAPSCENFQSQLLAPGTVGGCPFVRYPEPALAALLGPNCDSKVLELASKGQANAACQLLLQSRISLAACKLVDNTKCHDVNNEIVKSETSHNVFSKPTQFYAICKNSVSALQF